MVGVRADPARRRQPAVAESAGYSRRRHDAVTGGSAASRSCSCCSGPSPPGCAALTGVEAISNGVPAFRKPKSKNAATTLLLLGTIAVTMLIGIIVLANVMHVRLAESTPASTARSTAAAPVTSRRTVDRPARRRRSSPASRPASTWSRPRPALILVLAANTAFNGFPVLGSILAKDGYLPGSCTPAATGWRTATASCCWPASPSC